MTARLAYTRREAAELCGVSEDTIRRAKNAGLLKAKRLTKPEERVDKSDEAKKGGKELYTRAALEAWLESLADA